MLLTVNILIKPYFILLLYR